MVKVANAFVAVVSMTALAACGSAGARSPEVTIVPAAAAPSTAVPVLPTPSPVPTPSPAQAPTPAVTPTPAPAPGNAAYPSTTINAVYVGNNLVDLVAYEKWLGHPTGGLQLHTGRAGWADWLGSIGWLIDRWKAFDRSIYWSIPLMSEGTTLDDAGAGKFNTYYRDAARKLADGYPTARFIYVRTGWEFNGDWQPWAAAGKTEAYKAAFRQFVASFRSVSPKFVFEWAPNIGRHAMNPDEAYPGDDVVDIIGIDFYYDRRSDPADPNAAWTWMISQPYGLAWHRSFAAAHNKPVAYAEWGVGSDNDSAYVAKAARWFKEQPFVYQSYWNSNAGYTGKLSDNQFPRVSEAYKSLVAPIF